MRAVDLRLLPFDQAGRRGCLRGHSFVFLVVVVLRHAALDVFEREPEVHPGLLQRPNVVLVPHLGSATHETRTAMADLAARNVEVVLAGQPPLTPVTQASIRS